MDEPGRLHSEKLFQKSLYGAWMQTRPVFWAVLIPTLSCLSLVISGSSCTPLPYDQSRRSHLSGDPNYDSIKNIEDRKQLAEKETQKPTENDIIVGPDLVKDTIVPLGTLVLDPALMEKPDRDRDSKYRRNFSKLNGLILKAFETQKGPLIKSEVLEKYRKTLLMGCEKGSLKNCKNLATFALDSQSASICKIIAETVVSADVREYYRMLILAFELMGRAPDYELEKLFLKRAEEYIKSFEKDGKKIKKELLVSWPVREKESLGVFLEILEIFLKKNKGSEKAEGSASRLQVKEVLGLVLDERFNEILSSQLRSEFLQRFADELKDPSVWTIFVEKVLNSGVRAEIENSNNTGSGVLSGPQAGTLILASSYSQAKKDLERAGRKFIDTFGLQFSSLKTGAESVDREHALYFFLISELFSFQTVETLLPYWKVTEKNQQRFLDMMEDYLSVFLAHNALATQLRVSAILQDIRKEGIKAEDIIYLTVEKVTYEITPLWKDYFRRVAHIRRFFEREIEKFSFQSQDKALKARVLKTRNFFNELSHNVKYLVTYPSLIMTCYYLSKYEFKQKFELAFAYFKLNFELDTSVILGDLMAGMIPPFYDFTDGEDDTRRLDVLEMNYALVYTLKMDLPEIYGIPIVDWFNSIQRNYFKEVKTQLNAWTTLMKELTQDNSPQGTLAYLCNSYFSAQTPDFSENNFFKLEEVFRRTFLGREMVGLDTSRIMSDVMVRFFPFNSEKTIAEALEVVRLDSIPRQNHLKLFKKVFSKNEKTGPQVLQELDKILQEIEGQNHYIYERAVSYEKSIRQCVLELGKQEHIRRTEILDMELDFLGHVFLALSALHQFHDKNTVPTRELMKFNHPIWQEPFFKELNGEIPLLASVNQLIEKKVKYDSVFKRIEDYEADYHLKGGIQVNGQGDYYFVQRKLDLAVRLSNFISSGYNGKKRSFKKDRIRVELPETLKEMRQRLNGVTEENTNNLYYIDTGEGVTAERIEGFQKEGIKELGEAGVRADWFQDGFPISMLYRTWLKLNSLIYKLTYELDIVSSDFFDESENKKLIAKMSASSRDLLELSAQVMTQLNLNSFADDQKTLKWINKTQMFRHNNDYSPGPVYLFTVSNDKYQHRYQGIGDEVYNNVSAIYLGSTVKYRGLRPSSDDDMKSLSDRRNTGADPLMEALNNMFSAVVRVDPFVEAEARFVESLRKQKDKILFAIEPDVLNEVNFKYVGFFQTEMLLMYALEQESVEFQRTRSLPPMWFDIRLEKFNHEYIISPSLIDGYHDDISRFNERTYNAFLPKILKGVKGWSYLEDTKKDAEGNSTGP